MKYKRLSPSGCKDIEIRKFDFVVKTLNAYSYIVLSINIEIVTFNFQINLRIICVTGLAQFIFLGFVLN